MRKAAWLLGVFLPAAAAAQDVGRVLSWQDCVAVAAKNNPELASSRRALEASRASYYGSFNAFLPQVNLTNGYSDGSSFVGTSGPSASHWQAQASASVDLFNVGSLADTRSAWAAVRQAQAGVRVASADLRFNLRTAFAQLLFVQNNYEVSRKILEMRQASASLVALRYDSGRESKGNMLRSKAQALQAQAAFSQALRDFRTARAALNRRLGFDDFAIVTATGELEPEAPADPAPDLRPLLAARPDVAYQEAQVQSAQVDVSQARSPLWPTLSATYSRTRLGAKEFPGDRYSWSAGGLLSYPLFAGGPTETYYSVSGAKRNLEKAREDLRAVYAQARLDLESNWSQFMGAVEQVAVQAALLEASRQRNDEADVRYASGLLNYDNWEIIASDRISSERQFTQSRLNAANAEAAWARATGRTLGD